MTDERLYLLSEVAEMTGLSERSLADAARANKMPHYRLHGRRYMTRSQIDEYIAGALVQPPLGPTLTRRERLLQDLEAAKRQRMRSKE